RKRKGLPLISEADMEALRQGAPMSWEPGGSGIAAAPSEGKVGPAASAGAPASAQGSQAALLAAQPAAAASTMSNVQRGLPNLPRKALNNSVISAEQAYRKRKAIPALNDVEIYCLKQGVPMPWEAG